VTPSCLRFPACLGACRGNRDKAKLPGRQAPGPESGVGDWSRGAACAGGVKLALINVSMPPREARTSSSGLRTPASAPSLSVRGVLPLHALTPTAPRPHRPTVGLVAREACVVRGESCGSRLAQPFPLVPMNIDTPCRPRRIAGLSVPVPDLRSRAPAIWRMRPDCDETTIRIR